ncbi:hypothetical protein ASPZODRAFT_528370 [Penicilliopsis zonata CBS 506.65]|uniref:Uncharacterized protein n=1 Tax=Penicilliopsis zonata CBS 506.65 TaxID=1073090 RepID=A0A1L9SF24_9EURO|nr:hypothetical protein ASPZODRAFT_528370 [Penicilliopsis zonata CBS 506.65]OJJ45796.1 hypothetical protein ASPZODRAFT_528370 [Penicilliopsis zonata CBS 506.65]
MSSLYEIMAGLPEGYVLRTYASLKVLEMTAKEVRDKLEHNDQEGNQYIVILGLSKQAAERLGGDPPRLGDVVYRFTLDGSTGVLKVVPSWPHERVTGDFNLQLSALFTTAGVPLGDFGWARSMRYPGTSSDRQKEADECLVPATRMPTGQTEGWPTLVFETGVSESLSRLRNDARWWFNNSKGAVRIVLVISIKRSGNKEVTIEKWQLLPPGAPQPVTRAVIDSFRYIHPAPMPPLVHQPAVSQHPYDAQVIKITQNSVTGGPLVLPFRALMDRPPQGQERDIVLHDQELRFCSRSVF